MPLAKTPIPRILILQPGCKLNFKTGSEHDGHRHRNRGRRPTWAKPMRWRWRASARCSDTRLRPRLEMVSARLARIPRALPAPPYGFRSRGHPTERALGGSTQRLGGHCHRPAAIPPTARTRRGRLRVRQAGLLCEKPMGASLDDSRAMCGGGREKWAWPTWWASIISAPPPARFARRLITRGRHRRHHLVSAAEHTEDFLADPETARQLAHRRPRQRHPWATLPRT